MKKLNLFYTLILVLTIFASCEKECFTPTHPNTSGNNNNTGNNNNGNGNTINEDYPNLNDSWLFVEGTRYIHTEGITDPDTYEVLPYDNNSYEYININPVCVLDSIKVNQTVWEFTYSDLLVDYNYLYTYSIGFMNQTIEVNIANTKRIYTLIDYDNYDQTLVVRTTNQEWVDSTMIPKYQYSILKFYRSN